MAHSAIQSILNRSVGAKEFVNDISYIPRLELVFAFISKNASSTLKTYLANIDPRNPTIRGNRNPHFRVNTGFLGVDDIGTDVMERLILDQETPKVVVGRHPTDRLVSAYLSRVNTWLLAPYSPESETNTWLGLRQEILGFTKGAHAVSAHTALTSEITFPMFVDYLVGTPDALLDRHFAPQTFMCGSDTISYDLIGRVEELDLFIDELGNLLKLQLPPFNGVKINSSGSIPSPSKHELLNDEVVRKIEERYKTDFNFFGYVGT